MWLLGFSVANGSEIVWLQLTPMLSYKDLSTNCKTDGYYHHFLGAEIDRGEAKAAILRAGGMEVFYRNTSFTADELKGLRFEKDSFDRVWLTEYRLGERLLLWIIQNSGSSLDGCNPPSQLVTVAPDPYAFEFKIEGLGAGPGTPSSQFGKFAGRRKDGRAYQAGLYFLQEQRGF